MEHGGVYALLDGGRRRVRLFPVELTVVVGVVLDRLLTLLGLKMTSIWVFLFYFSNKETQKNR